ncbi:hypothetical protein SUBVAR_04792 [Subdoligranulum variabile DSM 15176]|uniref:Uncharacterized protein n=1 Tax=Subdoligranulum variabile DSM 15176 TaxID=411471 RepID=D1PKB7_9FIRM|nr:hypothetical protein SUBVAR_04792 [Subdoligranulum variabile DSM 15176]
MCYTCRPQEYGNGGARLGEAPYTTGWEKVPGAGRYTKSGQTT